ncbi:MAG: hypothetical protein IKI57_04390 [Clostridia bacterium]|nr:hypothetical protein [Clostridia bacterium]
MGTHLIPRANVKGQDRLFIFFTFQGLVGTLIGLVIGMPFYWIISNVIGQTFAGICVAAVFGFIGFMIGQVKVPDNGGSPFFKKVGGLYIREVLIAFLKFSSNKKKYVIQTGEDDVFEEHQESQLEKLLLNKKEEKKNSDVTE